MAMDTIIFDLDLSILQSQSNQGTQFSRPEAWAKNIISVGGVYHHDTLTRADDGWSNGASIGPAEDGRIKPDLVNFYDQVFTTTGTSTTAYTPSFNGTSAATPISRRLLSASPSRCGRRDSSARRTPGRPSSRSGRTPRRRRRC